jgi:hypothetical protein
MTSSSLMCATADGTASNVVDVYNGATGAWSTATLSVARYYIAAASVGNVALFAGGYAASALFVQGGDGKMFMDACMLSVCACCSIAVLFALRPLPLSRAPLQVVFSMLLMCTTVHQGHGRRLSSAWRAIILQLHLLETWLCSPEVSQEVLCLCSEGDGAL